MPVKPTFKPLRLLVQNMSRVVGDTTSFLPTKRDIIIIRTHLTRSSKVTEAENDSLTYDTTKTIGENERTTAKVLFKRADGKWVFLTHNLFPASMAIKIDASNDNLPTVGGWQCLDEEGNTIYRRRDYRYGTWHWIEVT